MGPFLKLAFLQFIKKCLGQFILLDDYDADQKAYSIWKM